MSIPIWRVTHGVSPALRIPSYLLEPQGCAALALYLEEEVQRLHEEIYHLRQLLLPRGKRLRLLSALPDTPLALTHPSTQIYEVAVTDQKQLLLLRYSSTFDIDALQTFMRYLQDQFPHAAIVALGADQTIEVYQIDP